MDTGCTDMLRHVLSVVRFPAMHTTLVEHYGEWQGAASLFESNKGARVGMRFFKICVASALVK